MGAKLWQSVAMEKLSSMFDDKPKTNMNNLLHATNNAKL